MENQELLEPAKLYKTQLKDKHNENVLNYFDELTKKSGVDIEANRATCEKYYAKQEEIKQINKKLSKVKIFKILFLVLFILGGVTAFISAPLFEYDLKLAIIFLISGLVIITIGIIIMAKIYMPRSKKLEAELAEKEKEANKLLNEAYAQMNCLNSLFEASISAKLFNKTCPLIQMDRIFDVNKFGMMREKYDLWSNEDENSSTLNLQSGSILGNPFVVFKDLNMEMGSKTYTGTKVITYYVGSGNERRAITETLKATIEKPCPYYSTQTYLVYGNEAAPNLYFSREPSNINSMNEEQIQKYVRKHEKDLDKLSEKQMMKNGNYIPIGNPEFELFFGGLDRDNEVEFRVLFTPLAQISMMQLLKSKEGYGDDFYMKKIRGLNIIQSEHSQGDTLFTSANYYMGYDYDAVKENFVTFNNKYFKALFFDFAPLLAIPIYQQHKDFNYIYKDLKKQNFTPFTHEVVANHYDSSIFANKDTKTDVILKTSLVNKTGETDIVNVTAHSFDTIQRVEEVPVRAHGSVYYVPVHWLEYIPLVENNVIQIADIGKDEETKFKGLGDNNVIYAKGLLSNVGNSLNVDIKKIKALMKD